MNLSKKLLLISVTECDKMNIKQNETTFFFAKYKKCTHKTTLNKKHPQTRKIRAAARPHGIFGVRCGAGNPQNPRGF